MHACAPVRAQVTITLDLKERTLKFAHAGRSMGLITDVQVRALLSPSCALFSFPCPAKVRFS